jgi:hypothetical protein
MIVNNPANAGLTPGPGISLAILSNSFSALTAVSFPTEPLVGAVSERDGAATEVVMLDVMSDAASIAEPSVRGCVARDGVGFGVEVGCCWTRLGLDEEGCDSGVLCFPSFLSIADNFGGIDFGMMVQNEEQEHEASLARRQDKLVTNPHFGIHCSRYHVDTSI